MDWPLNDSVLLDFVRPGTVLAGKFAVERVLGSGGMGVVVAARHLQLDQVVALKLPRTRAPSEHGGADRFEREARAAARIQSEHVARVFDVGALENGARYLVMEFLNGRDLGDVLDSDGALPIGVAVDYLLEACEAIAEAHALGIVHRDVKPRNLFLHQRGDGTTIVKVLDFGISKAPLRPGEAPEPPSQSNPSAHAPVAMTATRDLLGSPAYMSPEQIMCSRDVDAKTDVWSLGVTLFELLTGSFPFKSTSMTETCAEILNAAPARLRAILPGAPAELDDAIARCLEKEPWARFANVGDLAAAMAPFGSPNAHASLERILRWTGGARRPASSPPSSRPGLIVASTPPSEGPRATNLSWGRERAGGGGAPLAGFGLAFALGAVVLVAYVLLRPARTPATVAASPAVSTVAIVSSSATVEPVPPVEVTLEPSASSAAEPAPSVAEPTSAPRPRVHLPPRPIGAPRRDPMRDRE